MTMIADGYMQLIEISGANSYWNSFIPLEYDWMWGKNIKYFEVGGGLLISPNNIGSPLGLIRIGYRRMPSDGGFMFRAGVCGFIVPNELIGKSLPPILPWPAISFGYAFKAKKLKF
jgi:hypothetical protein